MKSKFYLIILNVILTFHLTSCQQLPKNPHITPPFSPIKPNHALIQKISPQALQKDKQLSGYYPIISGADAFAARSVLSQLASQSIDIQYYIWQNDEAGQLLLKDLWQAANRGVKIRLLLDDLNTNPILDQQLLTFSQHPNIQVRLVNPKNYRTSMPINFITSLPRFHRRMHNKSMTFDKQLSIIGGRNIGNAYLRHDKEIQFADLDVLLAGDVISFIQQSFDSYWDSPLSVDIARLVTANKPHQNIHQNFFDHLDKIHQQNTKQMLTSQEIYTNTINNATIDQLLYQGKIHFSWHKIDYVADKIEKLQKTQAKEDKTLYQLRKIFDQPKHNFTIISSYFVPTKEGVKTLISLANQGVEIKILTNSFDATDVAIVHTGYANSRKPLLKHGIQLYELKSTANPYLKHKKIHTRSNHTTRLHSKIFAIDDKLVFIGSYNIDPRSANINTESGVVIHDPDLAKIVRESINPSMLQDVYQLVLQHDQLTWQHTIDEDTNLQHHTQEPNMSGFSKIWVKVFSLLPIKWLL